MDRIAIDKLINKDNMVQAIEKAKKELEADGYLYDNTYIIETIVSSQAGQDACNEFLTWLGYKVPHDFDEQILLVDKAIDEINNYFNSQFNNLLGDEYVLLIDWINNDIALTLYKYKV
jgi:hypothetical protein